ncbi:MAG: hypothetical protein WBI53_07100 [Paludibacter sp.]
MPFNLLKKYNELLDIIGMSEPQRTKSLQAIFNRDIRDNKTFNLGVKPIHPTPDEDGVLKVETLFDHLTKEMVDKITRRREFDIHRAVRLHWVRFHIEQQKKENMLLFSVNEPDGIRTYIYDKDEKYVIVLEPLRNNTSYYLLSAYHLRGKDAQRDKMIKKYKRRLNVIY